MPVFPDYLGVTPQQLQRLDFIASEYPRLVLPVVVAEGSGQLSAGQVLYRRMSDGKYAPYSIPTAVTGDAVGNTGGTPGTTYTVQTTNKPVVPGTVVVTLTFGGAPTQLYDNGRGELASVDGLHVGTIDYMAGKITLALASAPDADTSILADYEYSMPDGAWEPVAILAVDVNMSFPIADAKALAFFAGHFTGSKLTPDISTHEPTKRALAARGIYIA